MITGIERQGEQLSPVIWIVAALVIIGTLLFVLGGQFESVIAWGKGMVG